MSLRISFVSFGENIIQGGQSPPFECRNFVEANLAAAGPLFIPKSLLAMLAFVQLICHFLEQKERTNKVE